MILTTTTEHLLCTGLPEANGNETVLPSGRGTDNATSLTPDYAAGNGRHSFDLEAIDEWYTVYDLTFVRSIDDAWNGDAKLLAVIIVVFSGIWPYLKVSQRRDQRALFLRENNRRITTFCSILRATRAHS